MIADRRRRPAGGRPRAPRRRRSRRVAAVECDIAVGARRRAPDGDGRLDLRPSRRAREQRRRLLELPARAHDARRVQPHHRRERRRRLPLHPRRGGPDAGAGRRRLDRQHHLDRRDPPERLRALALRDLEARDLGADEDDGARARPGRDPRERGRARTVADGGRGRVRRGRRPGGNRRRRAVGRLRGAHPAAAPRASRRRRARDALPRLRPRRRT